MNIFSKAAQGLNLTPGERAFLKLFKGWLITAIGSGLIIGGQFLAIGVVDWQRILWASGGAALLSVLHALDKYWTAHGDSPLATMTDIAISQVQQRVPQPIVFPAPTLAAAAASVQQQQSPITLTGMATVPPALQFAPINRHFGDSQIMPIVSNQSQSQ